MKKIKFWFLISIYVLLALAHGLLTYINTPDLSMEGNPLVAKLGLGWGALAIANIIVFALVFATAYYSCFKYKTRYTNETKYTAYCSQIVYDRPDMFWKGLIPKHITPYIAALGFSFLYSMPLARAVLVLEWLYITFNKNSWWNAGYFVFEANYCFGRLDVILAIIVAVISALYFFYKEFKKQLAK